MNFRFHCFQCFDLFHISKKLKLIEVEEFCGYLLLPIRKDNICHIRDIIRMLQEFMSEKNSTDCTFLLKFLKNSLNSFRKSSRLCLLLSSLFLRNRLSFKVLLMLCIQQIELTLGLLQYYTSPRVSSTFSTYCIALKGLYFHSY